jgi:hypothetical protein
MFADIRQIAEPANRSQMVRRHVPFQVEAAEQRSCAAVRPPIISLSLSCQNSESDQTDYLKPEFFNTIDQGRSFALLHCHPDDDMNLVHPGV